MAKTKRIKSVAIIGAGASGIYTSVLPASTNGPLITPQERSLQQHSRQRITSSASKSLNGGKHLEAHGRLESCYINLVANNSRIYDAEPSPSFLVRPGHLPPDTDQPLKIPDSLPIIEPPNRQERFSKTPVYSSLT